MSGEPIALSLTPAKQAWKGHAVSVKITDIGTMPLKVKTSTVILHAHCQQGATNNVSVTPATFTLRAGETVTAHVTVADPPGDYGVLFQGLPVNASGDVLAGAVGSQVLAGGAQSCVPVIHHIPKASPLAPSNNVSLGGWDIAMIPVIALAAILVVWALVLWRKSRRLKH